MKAKKLTELALLATLALIIFIVELRIPNPIPLPGVKLGLANIITVFAVYHYSIKDVSLMVFVRIFLGAVFGGSIMALLYSLSGAMLCLAGMSVLKRLVPERYIWLCSAFGAVFHNAGQIMAAMLVTGSPAVLVYFPFLLVTGCAAGIFTGLCAQSVIKRSSTFHKERSFYYE